MFNFRCHKCITARVKEPSHLYPQGEKGVPQTSPICHLTKRLLLPDTFGIWLWNSMFLPKTCFLDLKTKTQLYHGFNVSVILLMLISWARRVFFQASRNRGPGVFLKLQRVQQKGMDLSKTILCTPFALTNVAWKSKNTHFFLRENSFSQGIYIYICLPVSSIQRLICCVFKWSCFLGIWGWIALTLVFCSCSLIH